MKPFGPDQVATALFNPCIAYILAELETARDRIILGGVKECAQKQRVVSQTYSHAAFGTTLTGLTVGLSCPEGSMGGAGPLTPLVAPADAPADAPGVVPEIAPGLGPPIAPETAPGDPPAEIAGGGGGSCDIMAL